ncbi:MAG: hypothetical protein PHH84_03850 [Oscillospiraceae bacterium]|nr:hypothetical protein [Oscillospiraceae bacterium]
MKRMFLFFIVVLLSFSFVSCTSADLKKENSSDPTSDTSSLSNGNNTSSAIPQGEPVPTFTVDWPSEMLPSDFPDLGKITKVYDSRAFVKKVTVNWNIVSEDQAKEIVDKLNAYLDYDHVWQGDFYSDGIKYKLGTEDESIRIVVRYMKAASGEIEPEFKPQFYLEISGAGIPDKK